MSLTLNHDKKTRRVTVTLTFQADEQIEKPGLEANVIENHLLTQATELCRAAANAALHSGTLEDLERVAAAEHAAIDAHLANHRAVRSKFRSDVKANPAQEE